MLPAEQEPMPLPAPTADALRSRASASRRPASSSVVVQDVAFRLKAGQALGIIGPSASGKSSLVRMLVGVWTPVRGKIRLDGAALEQWSPEALGRTSAICRKMSSCSPARWRRTSRASSRSHDPEAIIAAAQAAGVHELILRLPQGYETQIGEGGRRSRPGSASGSRWRARSMASRS